MKTILIFLLAATLSAAAFAQSITPSGGGGSGPTLGPNVATFLATPSSANLRAALTDSTGTGSALFANNPTFPNSITLSATNGTDGINFANEIMLERTNADEVSFNAKSGHSTVLRLKNNGSNFGQFYSPNGDFWILAFGGLECYSGTFQHAWYADSGGSVTYYHNLKLASATGGLGYTTGAGATATQATSKATGVTLNNVTGQITMNGAALASAAYVSFVVTDSAVAAVDTPIVCVQSGGTSNAYIAHCTAVAAGSFTITVQNITAGSLSESPVVNFNIIKGSSN